MTHDEQNRAVAEMLGVANRSYTTSLDACAEMRKALTKEQQGDYTVHLVRIVRGSYPLNTTETWRLIDATAPQHVEAFLRQKNLWRDGEKGGG